MEPECRTLAEALAELDRVAPGVPLLALGQTVFWDEPMKAGVALHLQRVGSKREFFAGVHDTDYFAKLPSGPKKSGKFKSFPHNDTTTRALWSAAGEFSSLFGSETVITRDVLSNAGLRMGKMSKLRPGFLDEATEAFGWRGIVSLEDNPPVVAETPLRHLLPELIDTLDWALDSSLRCIVGESREAAEKMADELRSAVCEAADEQGLTVSQFYRKLLPTLYRFASALSPKIRDTATTELLRFNSQTCGLARFGLARMFVEPSTREIAKKAYDEAIQGSSGFYELHRFGTGAIPFDLYIPGKGRGTIRLGLRGAVVATPEPQFLSFKKPLKNLNEFAAAVEAKFGPDCALIGKAVTLIGMLATEFVFVFHEGASSYVKHSARLHRLLGVKANPILRIKYNTWDALQVCCSWLQLPEPLREPYASEEMCAPSVATRWREIAKEQEELLQKLGTLRRPIDLIRFLDENYGGFWKRLADEYEALHQELEKVNEDVSKLRHERHRTLDRVRELRKLRVAAEQAKGQHFREKIFQRDPADEDLLERNRLTQEVDRIIHEMTETQNWMHSLLKRQSELVQTEEVMRIHERRRSIEIEAELRRLKLIRSAVIASKGMQKAAHRPSAWWFRLVCPDGLWYRETVDTADHYLEPLA